MLRFVMPIVLVGIAVTVFFMFTNPFYYDIQALKATAATYTEALDNAKALENARDTLTAKENAMDPNNIAKLQKLLPDNVNNIRLILEIGQIATPYGMVLKNVKYSTPEAVAKPASPGAPGTPQPGQGGDATGQSPRDYGAFDLEFSISGSYFNFISFIKDLESNLRIVDVSSITFSSDSAAPGEGGKANLSEVYSYDFKIKTYWLKN